MSRKPPRNCRAAGLLLVAALGSALLAAGGCARRDRAELADLGWLTGHWEGEHENGRIDEMWSRPAGGTILGASRVTDDGRTLFREFFEIRQDDAGMELVVMPQDQAPVVYRLVERGKRKAVFTNPAHDFPQRLVYEAKGSRGLTIRAEGQRLGKKIVLRLRLERVRAGAT